MSFARTCCLCKRRRKRKIIIRKRRRRRKDEQEQKLIERFEPSLLCGAKTKEKREKISIFTEEKREIFASVYGGLVQVVSITETKEEIDTEQHRETERARELKKIKNTYTHAPLKTY